MPKLKSNRGAAKRFRTTASGKIKFRKANRNHILTPKPVKRKAQARATGLVNHSDEKGIKRLLLEA